MADWAMQDFQKDALIRQMNEYKREKATLESRIEEIQKRSTYHDDHIRIADAWILQVSLCLLLIACRVGHEHANGA